MKTRSLADAELASFTKQLLLRLMTHEIACLDDATSDRLAALLEPLSAEFEASVIRCVAIMTEKQATFAIKANQRRDLLDIISTIQNNLVTAGAKAADYEACGLHARRAYSTVIAQQPTGLSATSSWSEGNTLRFKGNNKFAAVAYEIWRYSPGEPWTFIDTTRKRTYIDTQAIPGKNYIYRVRAAAARNKSPFSNTAMVNKA